MLKARPKRVRWYRNEWVPRWIGALSSTLSAAGVLYAVSTYLVQSNTAVALKIERPLVIEFRCSSNLFDARLCFDLERPSAASMTVTAALQMSAKGPSLNGVSISRSTATVEFVGEAHQYELHALWTADFVPGQAFSRQQVVSTSLRGGESIAREMWYFPLSVNCAGAAANCTERQNFLPWQDFWGKLKNRAPKDYGYGLGNPEIRVSFMFWGPADQPLIEKAIVCKVIVGESVGLRVYRAPDAQSIYFTLPCERGED